MNPEVLVGMEVGKGVLQRLLGQGSMGTVYLASQAQRKVAIKIFFPSSQLEQADHEEFQQRLMQVIAQGTLLDHEHILRVLDYGEQSGFLYQVTPYIAGENLQQLLTRSGQLPFVQILHYLEQLAAALDYAHAHGVLHRDIKPENILLTHDGSLFLADFGLAGLTTEKMFACTRRATHSMLNAIAPEYVLSAPADTRADLYSLGVVLYHMVTGNVPFQSTSLIEVAMQHVKATPPAPDALRPDLPPMAAQVIMRALAKNPTERYGCAQELASAFRLGLLSEPAEKLIPDILRTPFGGITAKRLAVPRDGGLFDPKWQAFATTSTTPIQPTPDAPVATPDKPFELPDKGLRRSGFLHLTNLQVSLLASPTQEPSQGVLNYATMRTPDDQLTFKESSVDNTSTPFGQFSQNQTSYQSKLISRMPKSAKRRVQIISLVLVALVVVVGSGMFWITQNASSRLAHPVLNPYAHATARAQATANANLILADTLSQNTRNWIVGSQGSFSYAFKNGAYVIANADKINSAPALLPNKVLSAPFAYSLTMEQLQGDLTSPNNQFGLLLDTSIQNTNGKQIETFYAFEVVNKPGGQYQFWKYDSRKDSTKPWTLLWSKDFGTEFRQGSGPQYINTLKVMDTGKNFLFVVNGTQVGMWQDGSFASGSIGMLVNLNGAEVAFSHLLVTYM